MAITVTLACLLVRGPIVRADYLKIGSLTGANRDFSATVPVTYNFGVTTAGGEAGLSVISIDFIVSRGSGVTAPVVFTIYNDFGGIGTAVVSTSVAAASISGSGFNSTAASLSTAFTLSA